MKNLKKKDSNSNIFVFNASPSTSPKHKKSSEISNKVEEEIKHGDKASVDYDSVFPVDFRNVNGESSTVREL